VTAVSSGVTAVSSGVTSLSGTTTPSSGSLALSDAGPVLDATTSTSGAQADGGPAHVSRSPGCGAQSKWTGALDMWVAQPTGCAQGVNNQGINNQGTAGCQPIPPGSTVPAKALSGSPENRGWWVYVPKGYDPQKPYRVIFNGAGCGDGNYFNAGKDGYPYATVDNDQAILVGMDYDTFSEVPGCYDDRNPQSNDLAFFPWLQANIESTFCVDTSQEFFSGYGSENLIQQIACAFPGRLRGFVSVATTQPGSPSYMQELGSLPPCASEPTAELYVHDFGDTDDTYQSTLFGCQQTLAWNGCQTPDGGVPSCNPLDPALTTPYRIPSDIKLPPNAKCVQFNGCPAAYPVVFCVTYNQDHSDDANWGVVPLAWDFMNRLPPVACPAGLVDQNGTCVACGKGESACQTCVDEQTDPNNCGGCDFVCAQGATCQAGVCICPVGATVCKGSCVPVTDYLTDPSSCGACGNVCPTGGTCVGGVCTFHGSGGIVCNGAFVDVMTDPNNCGACEFTCDQGASCESGRCVCPTGQLDCSGTCEDVQNDPDFCGSCDNTCPGSAPVCIGGVCTVCPNGTVDCFGSCTDTKTDNNNCGSCGAAACPTGGTCVAGVCTCPVGTVLCGDVCADRLTDPSNCGGCGLACPGGAYCDDGLCVCPPSLTVCAGLCVYEPTDPNFCGSCDNSCPGSAPRCVAGVCTQ
jgi:poly(3-hydroxybutyrate) depolymerase